MPDITMCYGAGCPLRRECYRYMATPNPYRQSYTQFKTTLNYDEVYGPVTDCDHYIPLEVP